MFGLIPAHTFRKYAFTSVKSCLLSYSFSAKFDIDRAGSNIKPVCFEPILLMQSPPATPEQIRVIEAFISFREFKIEATIASSPCLALLHLEYSVSKGTHCQCR